MNLGDDKYSNVSINNLIKYVVITFYMIQSPQISTLFTKNFTYCIQISPQNKMHCIQV